MIERVPGGVFSKQIGTGAWSMQGGGKEKIMIFGRPFQAQDRESKQ